ncbi:hypothetical protein PHLGIDRAFT_30875 [Phlebiopsis gigantea 11061_1 CR5-6]|uniref:Tubulin-tyrosine ligase n=1 Tax=Phlebiopsis gigantea (strain 11061_1 CR5-6) TaxID=745531 RepID=A0A0C3S8R6_PHLG1|nr:hypothetical protein PHLGIDRAFT_30875 [Phlebiopsis gigantea 11061_1 CR5-6]
MTSLPQITAFVSWPSAPLTDSLVRNALSKIIPPVTILSTLTETDKKARSLLQWATYDAIDHELTLFSPGSLTCAYTIRKALIRKHFLSRSAYRHVVKHPDSPLKNGVPKTWEIELHFLDELDEMWADELYDLGEELDKGEKWMILKPGMSDRGQGIRLFHTKEELESIFEEFEDDDSDGEDEDVVNADVEDDGPDTGIATSQLRHFVIQEYLSSPLLLDPSQVPLHGSPILDNLSDPKGHKFHLRAYCVASGALTVYLYTRILALFSSVPYSPPTSDDLELSAHLTNTSLQTDKGEQFVRLLDELAGCAVLSGAGDSQSALSTVDLDDIRDQIAVLMGETFNAALGMSVHFQPLPNVFELFGVDFLVTHHPEPTASRRFHVSLLEVNAEPAIELTGPRLTWILEDLFCAIAQVCVTPYFRAQLHDGGEGEEREWSVGETKENLRKCLDVQVRAEGGW